MNYQNTFWHNFVLYPTPPTIWDGQLSLGTIVPSVVPATKSDLYSYSKMNINIDLNILKYELFLANGYKYYFIHKWLLVEPNARSS